MLTELAMLTWCLSSSWASLPMARGWSWVIFDVPPTPAVLCCPYRCNLVVFLSWCLSEWVAFCCRVCSMLCDSVQKLIEQWSCVFRAADGLCELQLWATRWRGCCLQTSTCYPSVACISPRETKWSMLSFKSNCLGKQILLICFSWLADQEKTKVSGVCHLWSDLCWNNFHCNHVNLSVWTGKEILTLSRRMLSDVYNPFVFKYFEWKALARYFKWLCGVWNHTNKVLRCKCIWLECFWHLNKDLDESENAEMLLDVISFVRGWV